MIVYLIFVIAGVLLLAAAVATLQRMLRFLKTAERAVGTVVQVVEKPDDEGTLYYPVYEIPTRRNETVTYRPVTSSSSVNRRVGDKDLFIFDPANPENARPLAYWAICWWPLSLLAVAVNLLIIGGGYFVLRALTGI